MKDIHIRQAFHREVIEKSFHRGTVVLDEFNMGKGVCRADIMAFDNHIFGFEIKSEKDNLTRLTRQVNMYDKCCERPGLIVHEKHLKKSLEIISPWWDVVVASGTPEKVTLECYRRGYPSEVINVHQMLKFLWKREILSILDSVNASKYKDDPNMEDIIDTTGIRYYRAIAELANELQPQEIIKHIIREIKLRAAGTDWSRNYHIL